MQQQRQLERFLYFDALAFFAMIPIGLVYSINDPTELAIQKMIDPSQRMISVQSQVQGEARNGVVRTVDVSFSGKQVLTTEDGSESATEAQNNIVVT